MTSGKSYKVVVVFKDSEKPNIVKSGAEYSFAQRVMEKTFNAFKDNGTQAKIMMFEDNALLPNISGMIGVERAGYLNPKLLYLS